MTNEEARRKSGRDMERNRQQSGRDMEESRRASGRKMRDDMRALAENNRLERTLPVLPVRGKQSAKRGSAVWQGGAPSSGGGGGIDSPLTEPDYDARTYHEPVILTGDFLVAIELKPLKQISMTDRGGAPVVFNYDYKPEEP